MSKFNTYIRQINDIAAEAFKEYTAAKDNRKCPFSIYGHCE